MGFAEFDISSEYETIASDRGHRDLRAVESSYRESRETTPEHITSLSLIIKAGKKEQQKFIGAILK